MSFTSRVKDEVLKLELNKAESISLVSAIIKSIGQINNNIKLTTENENLAKMLYNYIQINYGISSKVTVRRGYNFHKNYLYIIEINNKQWEIINDLGLDSDNIKNYLIDDYSLKRAYLSGIFLAIGSINDPKTARYHLEFITQNSAYALSIMYLLNEFNLNSRLLKRESKYMIYIKEAEKISDFLRVISATNSLLYYEDVRIYRESKNMTNRLNNCEQANVDKIIMASSSIINDIKALKENDLFDLLDEKVKLVAEYRIKYEDVSLKELSEIISSETQIKITKSGISHRLNKIKELALKLKKKIDLPS